MTGFQLSLPGFEGPVDALPPMVSARQLDLEELPLAAIPAQFLEQTRERDAVDLEAAGEVLATLSRLMLLKSIHLLAQPIEEEEDEPPTVRDTDKMPGLSEASAVLGAGQGGEVYASPGLGRSLTRRTIPRSPQTLVVAWQHLLAREGGAMRAPIPAFVRLEAAMGRILGRLRVARRVQLSQMLQRAGRREAVMHFLAVLELVRVERVRAIQSQPFEEITVEWADSDPQRRSRAG